MTINVAPVGLARDLAERGKSGKPIRIGLIGSGEMGTDIVARVAHMPGIEVGAISELNLPNAHRAVDIAYQEKGHAREVASGSALNEAIEAGKVAVTNDADLILNSGLIDVVIDATGVPAVGAEIGLRAMEHGKHLVMMNVEADVTIGAYLKSEADRLGVTYSLGAGDEPSSCMELIEFVSAMGHTIVAAGKGKNNPLNIDAVPHDYAEEAARRNMNVRMLVEFVDGSKTMVEMAAIANATGLVPDKAGMHGPAATLPELNKVLVPEKDGGVLSKVGVVDYSIGKGVAPGVFVIADMSHPRIRERMEDLKMGHGPYFTFHRPYHLTSLEVPLTCARVVLYGKADMVPLAKPVADVCAVAKKDLAPGDALDAIGEYTYRAWIMTAGEARAAKAIPCGLLQGGTVTAPIRKGELITSANAAVAPGSKIAELRARQDRLVYGAEA
ncbi:putative homoserine dehydrogenase-like protein [Aminobacter aminovorans]|uniref:Predicted homoserine dehydrogenase n=2 Tax=Aminobacter aminovorans TaxID=83263 RepID=A0A381ILS0_AMIAI|nr:NAD(P)H-dependent oxidoreductase [Aminobacter aminovorans]TCS19817.1 putative homoserine dehydrogenase-like protein [Aminobacter aminovorans]TCS21504.1 putative homoserine dehydrogenase-like protein [Aminobacter aminovorans]SUU89120.1 Predicted homoserine dehydrogenase [Aminobacter aminovorans]SUY29196.1 Predicted homoserine dehydrogenase [Aminobacter aminovorans]